LGLGLSFSVPRARFRAKAIRQAIFTFGGLARITMGQSSPIARENQFYKERLREFAYLSHVTIEVWSSI
jgi:hypothetical protein